MMLCSMRRRIVALVIGSPHVLTAKIRRPDALGSFGLRSVRKSRSWRALTPREFAGQNEEGNMGGSDSSQHPANGADEKLGRVDKGLLRAAHWADRHSAHGSSELPVSASEDEPKARWTGLASAFEHYAIDISGVPGASSAVGVLSALYGVEDAQAAMLGTIERNVSLLREGPFQSGRLLLQEAGRVGAADPEYQHFLSTARDHFYDARALAASVQERAIVEFNLGAVYALEGRPKDAEYWLRQAYDSARSVVTGLASGAKDVKVLHSKATTAAASSFYPAGALLLPAKLKKVWDAEHASRALEAFVPFVNCVVRSFNSLSTDERLEPMEMSRSSGGTYAVYVGGPLDPAALGDER
jgi:hypothetical protein